MDEPDPLPRLIPAGRALKILADTLGDYGKAKTELVERIKDGNLKILPKWRAIQRIAKQYPVRRPRQDVSKTGSKFALQLKLYGNRPTPITKWQNTDTWAVDTEKWDWKTGIFAVLSNPNYVDIVRKIEGFSGVPSKTRVVFGGVRFIRSDIDLILAACRLPMGQAAIDPKSTGKTRKVVTGKSWSEKRAKRCPPGYCKPALAKIREDFVHNRVSSKYADLDRRGAKADLERLIIKTLEGMNLYDYGGLSNIRRRRRDLEKDILFDRMTASNP